MDDVVLWIVVGTALAFDFTNGFHDTANAVATSISTRAMPPRLAVGVAASLNFVGAFLSLAVAATIASGIVDADVHHACDRVRRADRRDRLEPRHLVLRPAVLVLARADRRRGRAPRSSPRARRRSSAPASSRRSSCPRSSRRCWRCVVAGSRSRSPTASSAAASGPGHARLPARAARLRQPVLALARHQRRAEDDGDHLLALVANGNLGADADVPTWVVVWSATAIALGTYVGGWRIISTMGSRIIKMDPAQGFAAQAAGAAVILSASHVGFPLSTTHVITGGDHGRRRRQARCPPCAGAWPATSSARGC